MATVSMSLIKELREKTQVGFMDCKKALEQAGGNIEEAIAILRKKGARVAAKRSGHETNEGIVSSFISDDFHSGALVRMSCETDFSANTNDMVTFSKHLAEQLVKKDPKSDNPDDILDQPSLTNHYLTLRQQLEELIAKISENIKLSQCVRFSGDAQSVIQSYIHPGANLGVLVQLQTSGFTAEQIDRLKTLAKDICMQIAVTNPLAIKPDDLDPTLVEKEKTIFREQLKAAGKPEAMIEKIIMGKVNKYYQEVCLLKQAFIKDEKISIENYLHQVSHETNTTITIERFARFAVGAH